jgi:hypothetical protein
LIFIGFVKRIELLIKDGTNGLISQVLDWEMRNVEKEVDFHSETNI